MRLIDCKQGSPEWWEAHRGIPSASSFHRILTARTLKLSTQANDLICDLIAQCANLEAMAGADFTNRAIEHGTATEPEARRWYEMERGADVQQVGMIVADDGRFGCSPDGLVGDDGGLELKCPQLKTQVGYLLGPAELPNGYKAQVHGNIIVTGRAWWDFVSYAPGLPPFMLRVVPDEYTAKLREALDAFWTRYQEAKRKVLG